MDVLTTIVHVWMSLQQMVMLVIDANVCRAFVGIHIYRMAVKILMSALKFTVAMESALML